MLLLTYCVDVFILHLDFFVTKEDKAMNQKGVVRAVCISERKGEQKRPVAAVLLRPHHGIVGDAHAGDWHRQVSLLAKEEQGSGSAPHCAR